MHTRQSVCAQCVRASTCLSLCVSAVCLCLLVGQRCWAPMYVRVCVCDAIMQDVERHVKCGLMLSSVKCGGGAMRNVANIWCGVHGMWRYVERNVKWGAKRDVV